MSHLIAGKEILSADYYYSRKWQQTCLYKEKEWESEK